MVSICLPQPVRLLPGILQPLLFCLLSLGLLIHTAFLPSPRLQPIFKVRPLDGSGGTAAAASFGSRPGVCFIQAGLLFAQLASWLLTSGTGFEAANTLDRVSQPRGRQLDTASSLAASTSGGSTMMGEAHANEAWPTELSGAGLLVTGPGRLGPLNVWFLICLFFQVAASIIALIDLAQERRYSLRNIQNIHSPLEEVTAGLTTKWLPAQPNCPACTGGCGSLQNYPVGGFLVDYDDGIS
ncbi:unnamed protein product [Protopolystoma xenopodis]|uniref:Uncharacterized protein n=1 Tax=Protopolystoma xenopodis TaxID=117903 RepID=A0A3S5AE64_9PLAT|nr:unnamed protein product [Protopolystoma xenopodis]